MISQRNSLLFIFTIVLTAVLFFIDLTVGSVYIPVQESWDAMFHPGSEDIHSQIIMNIRLPKAIVALLAGGALSVSGLQMQTLFRNPLAGPYVLGISAGASLGVAIFILALPLFGLSASEFPFGIAGAAWIGSALILIFVGALAHYIKDIMVILILGMMFSSGVTAIVQILQYLSHEEALKAYVIWTMGSLGEVNLSQLIIFIPAVFVGLLVAVFTIKPLNLLLLGEDYAKTMGLNLKNSRSLLFISTTLLAGTVTAFCGPIGFIGLALPHVTRMIFSTSDHRILIPANIICGAITLVICDIVSKLLVLPINAVAALVGIPVIIFVVLRVKNFAV